MFNAGGQNNTKFNELKTHCGGDKNRKINVLFLSSGVRQTADHHQHHH